MASLQKSLRYNLALIFLVSILVVPTTLYAKPIVSLVSFGNKKVTTRTVDTVVIHASYNPAYKQQTLKSILPLWKKSNAVAHYAIDPKGVVYQLVPERNIAFHAGDSVLPDGATDVNTRSIGIELLYDRLQSPTPMQYKALKVLVGTIRAKYKIQYVLGHDEVAPERKMDPWNFDWAKLPRPQGMTVRPSYISSSEVLSSDDIQSMTNVVWHEGCPVSLNNLRKLTVSYRGYDGSDHTDGVIVVNKDVIVNIDTVFKNLYLAKFPIRKMVPAEIYKGDDERMMAEDITSGFNCRMNTGAKGYSMHAYGRAVDINPRENPYVDPLLPLVQGQVVRDPMVPGTVVKGDIVDTSFKSIGWQWGGQWNSKKDYQHFSSNGK